MVIYVSQWLEDHLTEKLPEKGPLWTLPETSVPDVPKGWLVGFLHDSHTFILT